MVKFCKVFLLITFQRCLHLKAAYYSIRIFESLPVQLSNVPVHPHEYFKGVHISGFYIERFNCIFK